MALLSCPVHGGGDPWAQVRLAARDDRAFRRRRRIGSAFRQQHARVESAAAGPLRRFFLQVRDRVTARLRRDTRAIVLEEVWQSGEFRAAFLGQMRRSLRGGVFAGLEFEAAVSGAGGEQQAMAWWRGIHQAGPQRGEKPPSIFLDLSDELQAYVNEWLEQRAVGVWGHVAETTRKLLAAKIKAGLADGLSMNRLADEVGSAITNYADWQAMRVARTEMTGSMNFGQQMERQELEIPGKEWISTLDNRNRGAQPGARFDHLEPDGQIVPNDEAFTVSGQKLDFPGDTHLGASAGNVIHCRCAAVGAWPEDPLDVRRPRERERRPEAPPLPQPAPAPATPAAPVPVPSPTLPAKKPPKPKLPSIKMPKAQSLEKVLPYDPHAEGGPWGKKESGPVAYGTVLIDNKGRVLLREPANHFDGYHWTWPKGKPDKPDEHPASTAFREVKQETGYSTGFYGQLPGSFKSGSSTNYFYLGKAWGKQDKSAMDAETAAVKWVTLDEAEKLIQQSTNAAGKARDLQILSEVRKQIDAVKAGQSLPMSKAKLKTPAPAPAPVPKPPANPIPVPKPTPAPVSPVATPPAPAPAKPARKPRAKKGVDPGPMVPELPEGAAKPRPASGQGFPADLAGLRLRKTLGGSTGAKLYEDAAGNLFVWKEGASKEHLLEEFAAEEAYRFLGVRVPDSKLYDHAGTPVKLSRWVEGKELGKLTGKAYEKAIAAVKQDFAADALMANWDVAGLGKDNILVDAEGNPWRIDVGASLRFRAQGGQKGAAWDRWATEFWSLTEQGSAAAVFGGTTFEERIGSLDRILKEVGTKGEQEAFLKAVPEAVRDTLRGRLDTLRDVRRTTQQFVGDGWKTEYVGTVMKHRVGLDKAGILDRLPKKLAGSTKSSVDVRDENGKPFDDLRGKDGLWKYVTDYMGKNGGNGAVIDYWADGQKGSSWSEQSQGMKAYLLDRRVESEAELFWGVERHTSLALARKHQKDFISRFGERAVDETVAINHAFQHAFVQRVAWHANDRARGIVTLIRTERAMVMRSAYGIDVEKAKKSGEKLKLKRPTTESYSALKPYYLYGDTVTTLEMPHTRIVGNYFLNRGYSGDQEFFLGDDENEILAVGVGLEHKTLGGKPW